MAIIRGGSLEPLIEAHADLRSYFSKQTQDPGNCWFRRLDGDIRVPAQKSTIHAVLDRHGLVIRRGGGPRPTARARARPAVRRRWNPMICGAPTSRASFKLGNGRNCYPLTVTDHASRFLLLCEALDFHARRACHYRLRTGCSTSAACRSPTRSDNGVPFASPNALFNLSKALGLVVEARHSPSRRIKPGHPAAEPGVTSACTSPSRRKTTRPPGANSLQQQERFDAFIREFNTERPHEALDMKMPPPNSTSPHYVPYDGLPELIYPFHDRELLVTACGRLCLHRKEDQPLNRAGRPETRHQGSRRRHLARQLHAL